MEHLQSLLSVELLVEYSVLLSDAKASHVQIATFAYNPDASPSVSGSSVN